MDELYDLDTDPYEETNIIDRPDAHQTLQRMQAELKHLLEQAHYETPVPLFGRSTTVGVECGALVAGEAVLTVDSETS